MEKKSFQYRMLESDRRELKSFCAAHGLSVQEFIDRAVAEYRKKWVV